MTEKAFPPMSHRKHVGALHVTLSDRYTDTGHSFDVWPPI